MIPRHERITPGPAEALAAQIAAQVPVLQTARLTLRAPRLADFPAYAEVACSDRGRGIGGPMTRDAAWADWIQFASGWMLHGHGGWTVEETATGTVLGTVCVTLEPGDQEPELGFVFTAAAEGKGFAAEAATAARQWAYAALGFETLVSYVDAGNRRSSRLAERLGARRDPAAEAAVGHQARAYRHPGPARGSA